MARIPAILGLGVALLATACASTRPPRTTKQPTPLRAAAAIQPVAPSDGDEPEQPPLGSDALNPEDPQAQADVKLLNGPCKPFLALVQVAALVDGGRQTDSWELVQRSGVVSLSPEMMGQCAAAMSRGLRRFRSAAVESEAHVIVHQMARLMTLAYQRDKRYCPPTAAAVPASQSDLGEDGYRATATDFLSPTWKCLGLDLQGEKLHFQYEVRLPQGTAGPSFEVVARGRPLLDGPLIELKRVGTLSPDGVHLEVTPTQRRRED